MYNGISGPSSLRILTSVKELFCVTSTTVSVTTLVVVTTSSGLNPSYLVYWYTQSVSNVKGKFWVALDPKLATGLGVRRNASVGTSVAVWKVSNEGNGVLVKVCDDPNVSNGNDTKDPVCNESIDDSIPLGLSALVIMALHPTAARVRISVTTQTLCFHLFIGSLLIGWIGFWLYAS